MIDETPARLGRILWTIAALLVLWPSILGWATISTSELVRVPQTPFDRTWGPADQWKLIRRTSALIPPYSSVTVRAATKDEEMSMFMIALGLISRSDVRPSSYWGAPREIGSTARYVIALRCIDIGEENVTQVAAFPEGCLLVRRDLP